MRQTRPPFRSYDELRKRLRLIHEDADFCYKLFPNVNVRECVLMVKYGPQRPATARVTELDEITEDQWCLINALVNAHDEKLAAEQELADRGAGK